MFGTRLFNTLVEAERVFVESERTRIAAERTVTAPVDDPPHAGVKRPRVEEPQAVTVEDIATPLPQHEPEKITIAKCAVCNERLPTIYCSRSGCFHGYHAECLPELRATSQPPPGWFCPPCRFHYKLVNPTAPHSSDYGMLFPGLVDGATADSHDDRCFACNFGGELVLCDGKGCSRAYHADCTDDLAGLSSLPPGDWFCPACRVLESRAIISSPTNSTVDTILHTFETDASTVSTQDEGTSGPSALSEAIVPVTLSFDGSLMAYYGDIDKWAELLQRVSDFKVTEDTKNPPLYRKLTKNQYKIPRVAHKQRLHTSDKNVDNEVCRCAEMHTACLEGCLNRAMYTECTKSNCSYGADEKNQCQNRAMQRKSNKAVEPRPTPGKGWGLFSAELIHKGDFIIEYCGEIIDEQECSRRMAEHKASGQVYFHMLEISRDLVIDAGYMGNESRFINHSCNPNCIAEKRRVGRETRVGIFAKQDIPPGVELTYDYQFVTFAEERWECQCGEPTCRKFLGVNKREAMDAVAFAAAGLHKELKKTVFAPEGDAAGLTAVRPMRGAFNMNPLNPTVFYADRSPLPALPSVLCQIRDANLSDREIAWVKQQHLIIVGPPPKVPNALDDGIEDERATKRGMRVNSAARRRGMAAPVKAIGRGAASTPVITHRRRGYRASKLAMMERIAKLLRKDLSLQLTKSADKTAVPVQQAPKQLLEHVWTALTDGDGATKVKKPLRLCHQAAKAADMSFAALSWASAMYLRDTDASSFEQVGDATADENDVICSKCLGSGDLLCCDGCPRAYHLSCISLSVYDVPQGRWLCGECKKAARFNRKAAVGASPFQSTFPLRDAETMLTLSSLAPAAKQPATRWKASTSAPAGATSSIV